MQPWKTDPKYVLTSIEPKSSVPQACQIRLLTFNINGRPAGMTSGLSSDASSDCDEEYHLYNSQERRMRGFFEWMDSLPVDLKPNIICLQEMMWCNMIVYASEQFAKRGFVTHKKVDLLQDQGDYDSMIPTAGSGLGIYVLQKAFQLIESESETFETKVGVDKLAKKGFKWMVIESKMLRRKLIVLNTHPQAYQKLDARPSTGVIGSDTFLSKIISWIRGHALDQIDQLGGYPLAIARVHTKQLEQIRNTLLKLITKYQPTNVFLGGDMNINLYATVPDSMEEKQEETARKGVSQEAQFMFQFLKLQQPKIVCETREPWAPPSAGQFTWNGHENSWAKQLTGAKGSLSWLDYVLIGGKYKYGENRCLPVLSRREFPEIAPIWIPFCTAKRNYFIRKSVSDDAPKDVKQHVRGYRTLNDAAKARVTLGQQQLQRLRTEFDVLPEPKNWVSFVQKANVSESSQIWKGLRYYGLLETDFDVTQLRIKYACDLRKVKIGTPHPFRVTRDLSDHYAVLGSFCL